MNQLQIFARKNKKLTPSAATAKLLEGEYITPDDKVVNCWESKEKYNLYVLDPSIDSTELIHAIYEMESGMILVQISDSLKFLISFTKLGDFINRLKVEEFKVLFTGDKLK